MPHWGADDVRYYATFRHRRQLNEAERRDLLRRLLRDHGKRYDLYIVCVLPEQTELMFRVLESPRGGTFELATILEGAKRKSGAKIVKATGERFPPFFGESYDRIVRDDEEFESRFMAIVESPEASGVIAEGDDYDFLWIAT